MTLFARLIAAIPARCTLVLALWSCGCGNEPQTCEELDQAIVDRYGECGITVTPAPPQDYWTADQECLLRCNWPCNRDASCGALDGTDSAAAAERFDCLIACNDLCL